MYSTYSAALASRRMMATNLARRGGEAILAGLLIAATPDLLAYLGATLAQQVINLHLVFHLTLAVMGLPIVNLIIAALPRLMPEKPAAVDTLDAISALDPAL